MSNKDIEQQLSIFVLGMMNRYPHIPSETVVKIIHTELWGVIDTVNSNVEYAEGHKKEISDAAFTNIITELNKYAN